MNEIIAVLNSLGIPPDLSEDLTQLFLTMRHDLRTRTLERTAPGKFVETIAQTLQALDPNRSGYDISVEVEKTLSNYESRILPSIPDDSRVAIIRIARAMYCIRNKRSIAHKNTVDPNVYDLKFLYEGAQWILTELVRLGLRGEPDAARALIDQIQRPVNPIVEEIFGQPVVLSNNLSAGEEALLILYHYDPDPMDGKQLRQALNRHSSSAINTALSRLRRQRLIERHPKNDVYALTNLGRSRVIEIQNRLAERDTP